MRNYYFNSKILVDSHIRILILSIVIYSGKASAQESVVKAPNYQYTADSLYSGKQYRRAAGYYVLDFQVKKMLPYKKNSAVNAAFCYAKAGMPDSALFCLEKAVKDYGFRNSGWIGTEPQLAHTRLLPGYKRMKEYFQDLELKEHDPLRALIITSDIDRFWTVYDKYLLDTTGAEKRFLQDYIEKGSPGLQEYYRIKTPNIGGMKGFVRNLSLMKSYYNSIRPNLSKTGTLRDTFRVIFTKLKAWYPPGSFPNTTFVVGAWSSGGTSTDYGAIVGADMQSADASTVTSELSPWQKGNLVAFTAMKHVVAHELIHVQQGAMASDTTLLSYAIKEGMADFIGELISGKTANQRLHTWAKGKEQKVWADFKKEMYLDRYSNWIANSKQETADHPADLGYWVGYQICKAYFNQTTNKKQAIYDMLHIQDYRRFLIESKTEEDITSM